MNELRTAAVLGLGLMGGSVARELAARGMRILGYDADAAAVEAALREGVVASALPPTLDGLAEAELVVLAVPVRSAPELLRRLPELPKARLVTDVGSTKQSILRAAGESPLRARFVGAHPLAGDHRSGWAAGRLGLFQGAGVCLCASPLAEPDALAMAVRLWEALGARVEWCDPAAHDRAMALASHLPQAVSSALGRVLDAAGVARATLGPGGQDVTRLAGSDAAMWTDVALDNAGALRQGIAALQRSLSELEGLLSAGEPAALRAWFQQAADWSAGCRAAPQNRAESVAAGPGAG